MKAVAISTYSIKPRVWMLGEAAAVIGGRPGWGYFINDTENVRSKKDSQKSYLELPIKFIYYKSRRLQHDITIFWELYHSGVRGIFTSRVQLPDGTPVLLNGRNDYAVLHENFVERVYEKYIPKGFDPKVILDLGAHKGFFSIMIAKQFPNAQIYAVEANSENFHFLTRNTAKFSNIHPIHAAIWKHRGSVSLRIGDSINHSVFNRYGMKGEIEEVEAITLDDLPKADFIKCDIEGAEHELHFSAPFIALEEHNDIEGITSSVTEKLQKDGYKVIQEGDIAYGKLD